MKPRLFASLVLAAVWLATLFVFLQHTRPATSAPASPLDVVINEVAWMGTSSSTTSDEWIELYNNNPYSISLAGWTITTTGSVSFTIPSGTILAHGYFLLERAEKAVNDITADYVYGGSNLGNGGETIYLRDNTGALIDTANNDGGAWPAGNASTGNPTYATMERIDPLAADSDANWATNDGVVRNGLNASGNPINGTPKSPNSATSANLGITQLALLSSLMDQPIHYTLFFSNAGRLNVTQAVITNTLPPSVTVFVPTSPYTSSQVDRELVWQVGALLTTSGNLSVTFVLTPEAGFLGWLTNTAVITSEVLDYRPANNTITATTQVVQPSADVSVSKVAQPPFAAGREITYVITISNAGQVDAQGVLVTDTLPISVTFLRQSAPYTLTQNGQALTWDVGDVLTSAAPISWTVTGLVDLNATGSITNFVQASTLTYEPVTSNNSMQVVTPITPPAPVVLINGVLYNGYQLGDSDEAIQIINVGLTPVNLHGYTVTEGTSQGVQFPTYTLQINQRVWVARNAPYFYASFGFWPDFAVASTVTGAVLPMTGSWPGGSLGPSGDVQIKRTTGSVLDRLVYGNQTLPPSGWSGPTVVPYTVGGAEGQILARVPQERTGLPMPDTDTAADWIQFTGNYTTGQRVLYPGWDMSYRESDRAGFFWPFTTTTPATVTLGIAPDNAYEVVRDAIRSAQHSIEIELYELTNFGVITEIVQQARAGVSVTVLLEGEPVGKKVDDQELWACQEIEAAGGQCWFMHDYHPTGYYIYDRYDLIHAKFIILDRQRLVVTTQNLTDGGMPDDNKADGTYGSRGYVLYIESHELADRAGAIFDRDRDPVHADIARWPNALFGFGAPPPGYVPVTTSGGTTTTVLFPLPRLITDATSFELFTAPEAALRQSDGLLSLLASAGAGDEVYVEQMYEYLNWGDPVAAPNVRLQAYVEAARRGATVRLLLNRGSFDTAADVTQNITTTAWINALAQQEHIPIEARLGDPTRYGIHSKLVLVKLNSGARMGAYSHVGSINGSESSSKINRELAVHVESSSLFDELRRVFQADWTLASPLFLPLVMRDHRVANYPLISEVLYNPTGSDPAKEWIELYNPTGRVIDLSGWSLGDALDDGEYRAGRYWFPNGTVLPPGGVIVIAQQAIGLSFKPDFEFVTVAGQDDPTVPNMIPVGAWSGFGFELGNTGDKVILRDATGQIVDAVVWGDASVSGVVPYPGPSITDGHSLERRIPFRDTDDCSADFRDAYPPTPESVP